MRSTSLISILLGVSVTSHGQAQIATPAVLPTSAVLPKTGNFDPATFHAVNGTDDLWRVASENSCTGLQYEYGDCQMNHCKQIDRIDCVFDEWSEWSHCDCTGLHARSRGILTTNNERGSPCDGDITETHVCPAPCKQLVNCSMTEWSPWSDCIDSHAQKTRTRKIDIVPAHGGTTCEGTTIETLPCSSPEPPVDCTFSPWAAWNDCSHSCGGGGRTRHRNIDVDSAHGGKLCEGRLKEFETCNTQFCGAPEPCILGQWQDWTGCNSDNPLQKLRRRHVSSPAKSGGDGCEDDVREIQACIVAEILPEPCELSGWEEWSECDKTCQGGQQFRRRRLEADPEHGGTCELDELRETRACNTQSCVLNNGTDCELSRWGDWSTCSAPCGVGQKKRSRDVLKKMEEGGKGCTDVLVKIEKCTITPCIKVDCEWDDWQEWSGCTCSCDGGSKTRNRQIKTAPMNGGKLCEAHQKTEVGPCATEPCAPDVCRNASWGDWMQWGHCSVTCGDGFKKRKRLVEKEATACGTTVDGKREDFTSCNAGGCSGDTDCMFADWLPWSACSCSCYGVSERSRSIAQYSTGSGSACVGPTKQIEPCNPGLRANVNHTFSEAPEDCDRIQPPVDCVLENWAPWTPCTKTCGGGHKSTSRAILTHNKNGGAPCDANLTHISTLACNNHPCELGCKNCTWNSWTTWSDCSSSGQKHRMRQIHEPANFCGTPCSLKASSEVAPCVPPQRDMMYCVWNPWEEWSQCTACCGASEQTSSRGLNPVREAPPPNSSNLLFSGDSASMELCTGHQTNARACLPGSTCHTSNGGINKYDFVCEDKCIPIDCKFGDWGSWDKPSCEGLCIRSRVVDQINSGCGKPCNGPLIETKNCWDQVQCGKAEDCMWTIWSDWSVCETEFDHKQRTREIDSPPRHNGTACIGASQQVEPCGISNPEPIIDCKASEWGQWSRCTATCGGGTQTRTRYLETAAENGGLPCSQSLKEIQDCAEMMCETAGRDCSLSSWSPWSECSSELQQTRHRTVETNPTGSGITCNESLKETHACVALVVNCSLSDWTEWMECDKTCNGGQRKRHREVHNPPSNGGTTCEENLKEMEPCNHSPCTVRKDCEVSDWSAWSVPSVHCGDCQQESTRSIIQTASAGGFGCLFQNLTKTRGCLTDTGDPFPACEGAIVDCVWQEWGTWDACSCPCGGGTHRRTRSIQTSPQGAGPGCAGEAKLQVKPCNTQSCEVCRDGVWEDWTQWEDCTRKCGGGTKKRSRRIAQDANACGKPVSGNTSEIVACGVESCDHPVDCKLNDWSEWSSCSCTCFGTQSRARSISVQGRADGKFCDSNTREIQGCHPLNGTAPPAGCVSDSTPVDCKFAPWSPWQECSAMCGKGQQSHTRQVATKASDGGKGCSGPMQTVRPCNNGDCEVEVSSDCVWNEWGDWSACTKCAGQTFRTRTIQAMNKGEGALCEAQAGQQTRGCDKRECHKPTYCAWGEWQEWESCSVTCGDGKRQRSRNLVVSHKQPEPERLYETYAKQNVELRRRTDSVENGRVQELAISFAAGALSLVAFFSMARGFRAGPRAAARRASPLFMDEAVE